MRHTFFDRMDEYTRHSIPYFFCIDYELEKPVIHTLENLPSDIRLSLPIYSTSISNFSSSRKIHFEKEPYGYEAYRHAFTQIQTGIKYGNSYLANLTFPHKLKGINESLNDIYLAAQAPYKLKYQDNFVCFSPESFIKIRDGVISTFPMKGTRKKYSAKDGQMLLDDVKEQAEHATIVDLLRNDLNMVASRVRVDDYRYLQLIRTQEQALYQTSSKITGRLRPKFENRFGSLFEHLLPAGSVSGAPKASTVQLIQEAEGRPRGYYTGVFGVFDGKELQSAVMIRYIEKVNGQYYYRSGGGITHLSQPEEEYDELIHKIYVPLS